VNGIKLVLILSISISFLLGFDQAFAETKTWVGGASGNFNDGSNWSPPGIPQNSDDVIIDGNLGVNAIVTLNGPYQVEGTLTITKGDKLLIKNSNLLQIRSSGKVTNFGILETNQGNMENSGGEVTNKEDGIIRIVGADAWVNRGKFTNFGKLEIIGGRFHNSAGGLVNNFGIIINSRILIIDFSVGGFNNICNGVILGNPPIGPGSVNELPCILIGGEILPINTTSLLLVGFQTNLALLIPVALSAVGIGVILVRKKF